MSSALSAVILQKKQFLSEFMYTSIFLFYCHYHSVFAKIQNLFELNFIKIPQ